jgi:hypothetical protein
MAGKKGQRFVREFVAMNTNRVESLKITLVNAALLFHPKQRGIELAFALAKNFGSVGLTKRQAMLIEPVTKERFRFFNYASLEGLKRCYEEGDGNQVCPEGLRVQEFLPRFVSRAQGLA